MSIEIAVQVNEQGQLQIPDEIQRQLFPGMVVVLKLGEGTNGAPQVQKVSNDIPDAEAQPPGLARENGILVFRGEVEEGFDWDAFMQEGREAPLHPFEPDMR